MAKIGDPKSQIEVFQTLQRWMLASLMLNMVTEKTGIDLTKSENRVIAEEMIQIQENETAVGTSSEGESSSGEAAKAQPGVPQASAAAVSTSVASVETPSLKQVALAMLSAKLTMLERIMRVLQSDIKLLDRLAVLQKQKRIRVKRQIEDQQQHLQFNEHLYKILHVGILELRERLDTLNSISPDGTFTWVITDYGKKKTEAEQGVHPSFYSHPFYVHRYGYKLCLRMYLKGDGLGKNTHLSLFLVVMKSPWDNVLRWPFQQKITLMLYDQNFKEHIIDAFRPDVTVASFQKPETNMNVASGSSLFVPLVIFDEKQNTVSRFVVNDTMFLKVIIDVSDLASLKWVAP